MKIHPLTRQSAKKSLYTIIFKTDTRAGRFFDEVLLLLIFTGTIVVMLRSVDSINMTYGGALQLASHIITILFSIEYVLRVLVHPKPWQYIFSFYGIVDLLAVLPGYLGFVVGSHNGLILRSFRLLRLFRVFDLGTYESAGSFLLQSLKASRSKITVFLVSVLIIVCIVGTLMYLIEGPAAGFDNIPLSIYRSIVTITTVGYGDITPVTPLGQAISALLMLIGYGIIAIPTGIVSAELATQKIQKAQSTSEKEPVA